MRKKTIAQHITLPPAILGTVTVLLAVLSVVSIASLAAFTDSLDQSSLPALGRLATIDQPMFELQKLVILEAFAKDNEEAHSYAGDIKAALEEIRRQEDEYGRLAADSQDRGLTRKFESSLDSLSAAVAEVSELSRQGKRDDVLNAFRQRFVPAFDAVATAQRRRRSMRLASASQLAISAGQFAQSSRIAVCIGSATSVVLCVLVCLYSRRRVSRALASIMGSLEHNAGGLAACVSQVSSSSHALSSGCSDQAASVEEISCSVEEMNAMTSRNSENSARASAMMADTSRQITASNLALKHMIASMDAIKASSEKVAKINRTIDEIAFQTNILALNAAVEAARAGDAGMGFAVVADEVRNLAQRAAVAAKDTALLIEEAIENTQKGSRTLDQVASAIRVITEGAANVDHLLQQVKEASSQQAQGIAQISQAILQVNKITQQSAAGAEESAAASEELSGQAYSIQKAIQGLQALSGLAKTLPLHSQPPSFFENKPTGKLEPLRKGHHVRALEPVESADPETFLPMDNSEAAKPQTFTAF